MLMTWNEKPNASPRHVHGASTMKAAMTAAAVVSSVRRIAASSESSDLTPKAQNN